MDLLRTLNGAAPGTSIAALALLLLSASALAQSVQDPPATQSSAALTQTMPGQEAAKESDEPALVILLHGLARSARSMQPMAEHLQDAGFQTCNIDYPSRHHPIEVLSRDFVLPQIRQCLDEAPADCRLHFVTHSLGGIIARQLADSEQDLPIDRVVMLGPPNGGSEVVDKLGDWAPFQWLNGPAGGQLGTRDESLPRRLGPAEFDLGVIAGDFSINLILSQLIPGPDDGKVSVANAKLEGMRDFRLFSVSHPLMMRNAEVMQQTSHFLRHGCFAGSPSTTNQAVPCSKL